MAFKSRDHVKVGKETYRLNENCLNHFNAYFKFMYVASIKSKVTQVLEEHIYSDSLRKMKERLK